MNVFPVSGFLLLYNLNITKQLTTCKTRNPLETSRQCEQEQRVCVRTFSGSLWSSPSIFKPVLFEERLRNFLL